MKVLLTLLVTAFSYSAFAKDVNHVCNGEVREKAMALYNLHNGYTENIDNPDVILGDITQVPSLKAPNKKMSYDVLEISATPGKMGNFRMRFIFGVLNEKGKPAVASDCVLMGQEILDLSALN